MQDNHYYKTTTIFVGQFVNTVVLTIISYHSFVFDTRSRQMNRIQDVLMGPFDEFNERWYFIVGPSFVLIAVSQLFLPHMGPFMSWFLLFLRRCHDRKYSCSRRNTRKVIQSEYEDLYTGPEFPLDVRLAQTMVMIFMTLTFSSSVPILYAIMMVYALMQYWVDKLLLLRFYRKDNSYSHGLGKTMVSLLPLAVILHMMFGFMMFSYPQLLKSPVIEGYFGNYSQYFKPERIG